MKKILTFALLAMIATGAQAEEKKDSANKNKPVFTVIKENPILHQRPEPFGYVLGLLYSLLLRG